MENIRIKVEVEWAGDPKIPIYKIILRGEESIWEETYGSKEVAKAFLRGVEATFSFTEGGLIKIPPLPGRGF